MAQMVYDIEVAKTINAVNRNYNIRPELGAKARAKNERATKSFFYKAGKDSGMDEQDAQEFAQTEYNKLNKKQAMGFSKLRDMALDDRLPDTSTGKFARVIEKLGDDDRGNDGSTMKYIAWLMNSDDTEPKMAAALILKGMNEKRRTIQSILGDKFATWKSMIPDGYTTWQPQEGNTFYLAESIPADLAEKIVTQSLEQLGVPKEQTRKILAVGGQRTEYVVKEEIAETLKAITKQRSHNPISRIHREALKRWKIWQLIQPRRYFKYNLRNVTGDLDAVLAGNPGALKKVPEAFRELLAYYKGNGPITGDLADWIDRGGGVATLQSQEMDELKEFGDFTALHDKTGSNFNVFKKYWKFARLSTDFREAILRYAAYKDYLAKLESGRFKDYGASSPAEIDGLADNKDKAYWLSNDLLGAYDRVGAVGQALREHIYPFWSWKEANFKRYARMFKNAAEDKRLASHVGKRFLGKVAASPMLIYRIGKFALQAAAFLAMVQAWNRIFFDDEEKMLPQGVREKPHIILGRTKDGKVRYFSRIGALADILEWNNFDMAPKYVNAFFDGKMTIKEIAYEMAVKAPTNVLLQGVEPFAKTGAELISRRSFYPDVFKTRPVRDTGIHLAQSLGLRDEYVAITGKPSRGYKESISNFFFYTSDPNESAYYDVYNDLMRYKHTINKGGGGYWSSEKSNALYNAKLSLKYGDEKNAKRYLDEYREKGGTIKGMEQSYKSMSPVSGLTDIETVGFMVYLGEDGRERMARAILFYGDLMGATAKTLGNITKKGE